MLDRAKLTTEKPNPRSKAIDRLPTAGIVALINVEDRRVAPAVRKEGRAITAAVDLIVKSFRSGGRLFYVGAGTSGRLGVLDASECPPTFGTPRTMVQGIIAGGRKALVRSIEGAEDRAADGAAAIDAKDVTARDAVVGIAACGVTPFVRGAVERAGKLGAATVFVTCSPEVKRTIGTDVVICPVVGPEVVTGSTRMKAGTATKLVLNTLTTAAMVKIGKVHGNLMIDLKAVNAKLRDRAVRIVATATGLTVGRAARLLARAGGTAKTAIAMHLLGSSREEAAARLKASGGVLRAALEATPSEKTSKKAKKP